MTNPSLYTIEALQRGLGVLGLFNRESPVLSLKEIVDRTGLNKSTAFRIVSTLESSGYLDKDPRTKIYRPGLKVLQLGFTAISGLEIRQVARPYLQRLSDETNETVSLGVLDEMEVIYVDRVRTSRMIVGVVLGMGSRIPAHCASMGKVLLAYVPAPELKKIIEGSHFEPCTPNSISDLESLDEELIGVREVGYSTNFEELESGLSAVAAPLWNHNQQVAAAINISGSVRTISAQRIEQELAPMVLETAANISQSLGYGSVG